MAIAKGIEPNSVLFKYKTEEERRVYNRELHQYELKECTFFYIVELYSRRARTNGASITKRNRFIKPFLEALNIRVNNYGHDPEDQQQNYLAIGCSIRAVSEDKFESCEVDEVAERHYLRKVKNEQIVSILSIDPIQSFKENLILKPINEQEEVEWPPVSEGHLREYRRDGPLWEILEYHNGHLRVSLNI